MIEISWTESEPSWASQFEAFCRQAAANCLADPERLISICITDDQTIAKLNWQYRNKKGPTDVLSFVFDEIDENWPKSAEKPALGDIAISFETLQANAKSYKISEEEELKRLVIHGILHLLGKDHLTNDQNEPMLIEQEKILKSLADAHFM